ncbi:PAS domain-containing sensor histidine kinase [Duganella sp. LX20W]|uniref:histidine kinase n=1 Tax=Rugamonas brunnea TaxID=2758569 RepID=A0A7W2EQL4_9BURK|nr:PAS domain-containing sensor histidine kinase [Rugamonas brunnea]MBA5636819.1 PAS domain-containing sensor histidine kinase [Rugamonas brunnea]
MQTAQELDTALREARLNEARYRLLLEHSSEVSWMADCASGRLTYLSPAAERQFGYRLDTVQPLAAALLADLPARLARLAAGDLSRMRVVRQSEQPHADGHPVPVEIESTVVLDAEGRPATLVGVVRDLSGQRALAEQQKKFASMVSHEFRSPLATIDGAIQRLEMTGAHHDEATRKRYRKIQTAVDRLLAMVDDYLSPERLASIGRARQPNEISPQALLETATAQARARRAAITVRCDGLPQWIRCEPDGLRLALEVLLDNAIKYTKPDTAIELIGKKAMEGGIEFLVRDRGEGIPEADLARVCDKGYRGANAAGTAGSGLGLYMARAVVDVHGGTLEIQNLPESGVECRIWLPAPAAAGKSLAQALGSSDNSPMQVHSAAGRN